jgi:hypothetical protein
VRRQYPSSGQAAATPASLEVRSLRRSTTDQSARQARRARRFARYQEVQTLHAQGLSKRRMAKRLCLSRATVIRYLRTTPFPERAGSWQPVSSTPMLPIGKSAGTPAATMARNSNGLQREQSAVQAALELPYNNGQVEGQITQLKLLKRQSYGRAKLDLLRQRMLHAA